MRKLLRRADDHECMIPETPNEYLDIELKAISDSLQWRENELQETQQEVERLFAIKNQLEKLKRNNPVTMDLDLSEVQFPVKDFFISDLDNPHAVFFRIRSADGILVSELSTIVPYNGKAVKKIRILFEY